METTVVVLFFSEFLDPEDENRKSLTQNVTVFHCYVTVLVNIVLTYEYVYNTYFYSPMQKVYRISVCTRS